MITFVRNFLYNKGILKSYSYAIPIIAVGNLSVGGTGKTPQIEYLIRLLSANYKIATLSRGYKRKSSGFVLADFNSSATSIGDEPFQFFQKFPQIQVAVDADRKNGIEQLLNQRNQPEIILLDDAFQHRRVKAGFYILLTSFDDLFCDDFILPSGNLRESASGAKRSDCIIITKCPVNLSEAVQEEVRIKLKEFLNGENNKKIPLFFNKITYDDTVYNATSKLKVSEILQVEKLLLAGIAKPVPFFAYLQNQNDLVLKFSDHHHFSESDISAIKNKANNKPIITTEKDFVRLKDSILKPQLYYLPIKSTFISDSEIFDKNILEYVGKSSRNG